jgi:hypothetical protein
VEKWKSGKVEEVEEVEEVEKVSGEVRQPLRY